MWKFGSIYRIFFVHFPSSFIFISLSSVSIIENGVSIKWTLGVLTINMGKPEIPVGKSNGVRHSVWKSQKISAVIYGNVIFLHLEVCSADLDMLCSGFFSHKKC